MNSIEKIRQEIETLKEENRNIRCQHNEKYCTGYDDAFNDLLSFIDSLPDEPVTTCSRQRRKGTGILGSWRIFPRKGMPSL